MYICEIPGKNVRTKLAAVGFKFYKQFQQNKQVVYNPKWSCFSILCWFFFSAFKKLYIMCNYRYIQSFQDRFHFFTSIASYMTNCAQ